MRFDKGYVKLHRSVFESWISDDSLTLAIWVTLIGWANFREGKRTKQGKELIALKPGQVMTSAMELSAKLRADRRAIERRLTRLEYDQAIVQQVTTHGRVITICNWDKYQNSKNDDDQQMTSQCPSNDQPMTSQRPHIEEGQEGKNEKRKEGVINLVAIAPPDTPNFSPRKLAELWNQHSAPSQPKVRIDSFSAESKRYRAAKLRLAKKPDLEYWTEVIKKIAASDWCAGQTSRGNWVATFDWLIKPETHTKVMEGQYDNRNAQDSWTRPEGFLDEQPF